LTALAVTERCWHDLDALDPEVAERVLLRFEERRGIDPDSGEPMSGVGGPVRRLHISFIDNASFEE
jgi:hypothetical protein